MFGLTRILIFLAIRVILVILVILCPYHRGGRSLPHAVPRAARPGWPGIWQRPGKESCRHAAHVGRPQRAPSLHLLARVLRVSLRMALPGDGAD